MENNDSNKKVSIILILMIVLLFSILIFSWLETFGIIGKNSNYQTTVSVLLEETVNIIPDRKDKKIVISKKEVKEENIEKLHKKTFYSRFWEDADQKTLENVVSCKEG